MKNIIFVFVFFLISSCGLEMVIDVELPEYDKQMVLLSQINPDSNNVRVYLSHSISLEEPNSNFNYINNAEVKLFSDDIFIDSLQLDFELGEYLYNSNTGNYEYDTIYFYQSNVSVIEGNSYRLEATAPNIDDGLEPFSVTSTVKVPSSIDITIVDFQDSIVNHSDGWEEKIRNVTIEFDDLESDNYYQLFVFDGPYESYYESSDPSLIASLSFDPFMDETSYSGYDALFSDVLFNGETKQIELSLYVWEKDALSSLKVELRNVSESYYYYYRSVSLHQMNEGNPFAEPVQVYSNVENGLGVFTAYNKSYQVLNLNN